MPTTYNVARTHIVLGGGSHERLRACGTGREMDNGHVEDGRMDTIHAYTSTDKPCPARGGLVFVVVSLLQLQTCFGLQAIISVTAIETQLTPQKKARALSRPQQQTPEMGGRMNTLHAYTSTNEPDPARGGRGQRRSWPGTARLGRAA